MLCQPTQKNNILKFNQYMNSNKTPRIFYAGLESLIKKIDNCKNNPEESLTAKIDEHIVVDIICQLYAHLIV